MNDLIWQKKMNLTYYVHYTVNPPNSLSSLLEILQNMQFMRSDSFTIHEKFKKFCIIYMKIQKVHSTHNSTN